LTESYNTSTGQDSEPAAQALTVQQVLDGADFETSAPLAGTDAGAKITPIAREAVAGVDPNLPVIESPTKDDIKAIAAQYSELRRAAGGGEPEPLQFAAPRGGEYKDALDAAQQTTLGKQAAMYEQLIARGYTADAALKAAQDYVSTDPPKVVTDGKDDKFSTHREAAQRLFEIRKLESETAAKARIDAVRDLAHDRIIGKTSAEISAEFKSAMPAWIQTQADLDLHLATLRQQGQSAEAAAIEKYQEVHAWKQSQEDREAMAAAQAQPEPVPQPQPQQPLPVAPQIEQLRHTEMAMAQLLQNGVAAFNVKYANLAQVTDQRIHQQARQDAAVLQQGKTYLDGISAQRQLAETQAAQSHAQQYDAWGKEQDRLFQESLSEADRALLGEVQNRAQDYFKEQGFSDAELQAAWHQTGQLRDARSQKLAFDAIAAKVNRASIESKRVRSVPPAAQRPGIRGEQPTVDEARVAQLSRALDNPGTSQRDQVRIAAQLLAAQRGGRGRRGNGQGWM